MLGPWETGQAGSLPPRKKEEEARGPGARLTGLWLGEAVVGAGWWGRGEFLDRERVCVATRLEVTAGEGLREGTRISI